MQWNLSVYCWILKTTIITNQILQIKYCDYDYECIIIFKLSHEHYELKSKSKSLNLQL